MAAVAVIVLGEEDVASVLVVRIRHFLCLVLVIQHPAAYARTCHHAPDRICAEARFERLEIRQLVWCASHNNRMCRAVCSIAQAVVRYNSISDNDLACSSIIVRKACFLSVFHKRFLLVADKAINGIFAVGRVYISTVLSLWRFP